jgi:sporulation protein YlmC with PRC-barrel domain
MVAQDQISTLYDSDVYGRDGNKIGSVGQVWGDPGGQPSWVSVKTGLFGLNESLVPLQNAELQSDRLVVPFDKDTVKDAPNVDASADEPLDQDDVERLYQYYGLTWSGGGATTGTAGYAGPPTPTTPTGPTTPIRPTGPIGLIGRTTPTPAASRTTTR